MWEEASQHTEELLREFALVEIGAGQGDTTPGRLLELVADLQQRYQGVSEEPVRQRQAALAAGRRQVDVEYRVPPHVAQACRSLRAMLEESDAYCRSGELMTLPAPPEQQSFRDWYLGEFVRQVAGEDPVPWPAAGAPGTSVRWSP